MKLNKWARHIVVGLLVVTLVAAETARADSTTFISLNSPDYTVRMAAFDELTDKPREFSDSEKLALIRLLEKETALPQQEATDNEAYGDYYSDVITTVCGLKDKRSISVLSKLLGTGNMVISTVADFGPPALPDVLTEFNSPDSSDRYAVLITIGELMDSITDANDRAKIKTLLQKASHDPDGAVREEAKQWLAVFAKTER